VPTNYDNGHGYRLVIALHPSGGNDQQMYDSGYYGLFGFANDSTIFVAPNGQKGGAPCSGTGSGDVGCTWDDGTSSDLLLIDAVVAQIEESFCVDTNRIFAVGSDYGAILAAHTACERPLGGVSNGYIRAVAVYSGARFLSTCVISKPVAYYASHGTEDPYMVTEYVQGVALAKKFATANGCTWATPTKATGSHVCTSLEGCTTGYPLEFCSFVGGRTAYPDNDQSSNTWGPQESWTFLSQF
jgi:poly(3-hydroxybutyrate) depolymerase